MDRARFVHGFRHQPHSGEAAGSLAVPLRGRGETAETTLPLGVHSVAVLPSSVRAVLWNNEFRRDFKNRTKNEAAVLVESPCRRCSSAVATRTPAYNNSVILTARVPF